MHHHIGSFLASAIQRRQLLTGEVSETQQSKVIQEKMFQIFTVCYSRYSGGKHSLQTN